MAEKRRSPPSTVSASTRAKPAHAEPRGRERSVWHQPKLLNLISDVLLLFAALGLGWAAVTWTFSEPFFPLRELVLDTRPAQVTQAQLVHVARTAIHGNFFTARLENVRAAVEKLPWVRRAVVRRRWPDGLELSIEEHEAVAYWRNTHGGDVRLVNRQGEVFGASSDDASMPEFSGPQGSAPTVLERYEAYSKTLQPLGARLTNLDMSARGAWRMRLEDGMVIVLGREQEHSPIDARLASFAAAWPKLREGFGMQIARADLRYPNGFALTPMSNK